jgi:hypothetical protein
MEQETDMIKINNIENSLNCNLLHLFILDKVLINLNYKKIETP